MGIGVGAPAADADADADAGSADADTGSGPGTSKDASFRLPIGTSAAPHRAITFVRCFTIDSTIARASL